MSKMIENPWVLADAREEREAMEAAADYRKVCYEYEDEICESAAEQLSDYFAEGTMNQMEEKAVELKNGWEVEFDIDGYYFRGTIYADVTFRTKQYDETFSGGAGEGIDAIYYENITIDLIDENFDICASFNIKNFSD